MSIHKTDNLTGLPSRQAWMHALDETLAAGRPFGLVYMDLDRFMLLNDHHGFEQGDQALRTIAARLAQPGSIACRYGGDEFALLVFEGDAVAVADGAWRAATQVLAEYDTTGLRENAVKLNGLYRALDERHGEPLRARRTLEQPVLGATVVVLPIADHSERTSRQLLQHVDNALQAAQTAGNRNRVNRVP